MDYVDIMLTHTCASARRLSLVGGGVCRQLSDVTHMERCFVFFYIYIFVITLLVLLSVMFTLIIFNFLGGCQGFTNLFRCYIFI